MKFVAMWNKFKCYLHVYRFTEVYEMRKEIRGLCELFTPRTYG